MSFCGWSSGEHYKDHFDSGILECTAVYHCQVLYNVLLQVYTVARNVKRNYSTVPPSLSTHLHGPRSVILYHQIV